MFQHVYKILIGEITFVNDLIYNLCPFYDRAANNAEKVKNGFPFGQPNRTLGDDLL